MCLSFRLLVLSVVVISIAACGGSGSGSPPSPSPVPTPAPSPTLVPTPTPSPTSTPDPRGEQDTLVFEPEQLEVMVDSDDIPYILVGGSGNGDLEIVSSDPNVALVNAVSSLIEIRGAGVATITATKASDEDFLESSTTLEVTVTKYEQEPLVFANAEISVSVLADSIAIDFTGGSGEGELQWSVENSDIADADGGVIFPKSAGETTVTLTKKSDDFYSEQSASFLLSLLPAPDNIVAWMGLEDTLLTFDRGNAVSDVYRFMEQDCDVSNYATCELGERYIINAENSVSITDSQITANLSGWIKLGFEDTISENIHIAKSNPQFSSRKYHAVSSFRNKLFVFGGVRYDENWNDIYLGDIWSSTDGINWVEEEGDGKFGPRSNHQVVEFKGRLFLMGGWTMSEGGGSNTVHDIWRSFDGFNWELVETTNSPGLSSGFDATVFDEKIWTVGTYYNTHEDQRATIWSSSDGVLWQEVLGNAPFVSRADHEIVAFNNKLWVIGGYDTFNYNPLNDIWSSSDGVNWTKETDAADFSARGHHKVIVYKNKLWLIGGWDYLDYQNDIWVSDNGVDWEYFENITLGVISDAIEVTIHNDEIWIIGGLHNPHVSWKYNPEDGWRTPSEFDVIWP